MPSADRLQALRIFANDAAAALVSGRHLGELRFLADHDPLTRLLNRRAFVSRLEGEVARAVRYERTFGLVVTDLDGFKQLNDRFGHACGDDALVAFANVLVESLRKPDDAFRIGGDEFAVLLAEATEEDAQQVVTRVETFLERAGRRRGAVGGQPQRELRLRGLPRGARPTRRRCSASPTRRCTTRSGTAPSSASSRARSSHYARSDRA